MKPAIISPTSWFAIRRRSLHWPTWRKPCRATPDSGYLFDDALGLGGAASDPIFAYLANSGAPYSDKLSMLRQQYRHRVLAAGARDILERREVYTSLAATTAAAEDAIAAAFTIAGAPQGLAVMALGRLGSGEFDVLSDADLLFIGEQENRS